MTSLPVTSSPMVRRETPCSCDAVVVGCPDASKAMTLYACIRILLVCIIVKVSAGKLIQPGRLNQGQVKKADSSAMALLKRQRLDQPSKLFASN